MVSRDTKVHLAVLGLVVVVVLVASRLGVGVGTGFESVLVWLVVNGLIFGGAHLYLAVRGEGGMVPVEGRWRFLTFVAVFLLAGAVAVYAGDSTVAGLELWSIAGGVVVVAGVVYLIVEGRSGYRDSISE